MFTYVSFAIKEGQVVTPVTRMKTFLQSQLESQSRKSRFGSGLTTASATSILLGAMIVS